MEHTFQTVARIRSDFPTKFGIPRQSGLVQALRSEVVFEPEFRNDDALRGIAGFSHLWLLWEFSAARRETWSPMVRPPRLGGDERVGVFASRSPFRPNPIGLSCVKLEEIRRTPDAGAVLVVSGADLMDGTPILDIKPYLPYADAHPEARGGFAQDAPRSALTIDFPTDLLALIPEGRREALCSVLALDPRPAYQEDPERVYGMAFAGKNIRFTVRENTLTVREVTELPKNVESPV